MNNRAGINVLNHQSSGSEAQITLGLLKAVDGDDRLTQRAAALDLGIALGLVNTYLKRCAKKGLIKIKQVPSNRYGYFLTPKGFAEKSRLTAEFLSQSLNLFRQARTEYAEIFDLCVERGWTRLALFGISDLTEIAVIYSHDRPLKIISIVGSEGSPPSFMDIPIVTTLDETIDAYVITDLQGAQAAYNTLSATVPTEKILVPKLLELRRAAS